MATLDLLGERARARRDRVRAARQRDAERRYGCEQRASRHGSAVDGVELEIIECVCFSAVCGVEAAADEPFVAIIGLGVIRDCQ